MRHQLAKRKETIMSTAYQFAVSFFILVAPVIAALSANRGS